MVYIFTDGEVATKAKLDTLLPPVLTQHGVVRVTPVAGTTTPIAVTFPTPFTAAPKVVATAMTTAFGDTVKAVWATDVTPTGCTLWVFRTNTTATTISWQAWGAPAETFTTGSYAWESLLNASGGFQSVQSGQVSITPVAGTPTYASVAFATAFKTTPTVVACATSTVPGTVMGAAVTNVTLTGCRVWVFRTNSTSTTCHWIALGRT